MRRPLLMCVLICLLAATALPVLAEESHAGKDVQAPPDNWLAMAESIAQSSPSEPATQAAPEAAAAAAPSAWPPGLLMEGLDRIGARKPLDTMGIRVWGFTEASFTGRVTNGDNPLFGRVFDSLRPNNLQYNQLRLTIDRPYDTSKNFDWGGRFDMLYGSDARVTKNTFVDSTDYAILENVGRGEGANWLDFTQAYGQLWFKTGKASGLEVLVGKFATTHGMEVIDATGNALYSHSYLFGYAIPFTHTGAKLNYVFNPNWSAYFAIVNGWDVFEDNNDAHSYMAGGAWNSIGQIGGHSRDIVYLNVITGPEQTDNASDFRSVIDSTYTHWWTEKLSQSVNADYGTEQAGAPDGGRAKWYGAAHYLTYIFNDKVSGTWRAEWFKDDSGARIGVPGNYVESTCGLTLTPWPNHAVFKNLSFRPEIRWDHSDEPVFGGGSEHDQMTLAADVIFKF